MFQKLFQILFGFQPKKTIKKTTALKLISEYAELDSSAAQGAFEALEILGLIDHSKIEKESA